jgi:hypothetical protein
MKERWEKVKSFLSLDSFTKINRPERRRRAGAQKFWINYEIMISFISCFINFVERQHILVKDFRWRIGFKYPIHRQNNKTVHDEDSSNANFPSHNHPITANGLKNLFHPFVPLPILISNSISISQQESLETFIKSQINC